MTTADHPEPWEKRLPAVYGGAPPGYPFPQAYIVAAVALPDIDPLMWILERNGALQRWTNILKEQFPARRLIPFAKENGGDDVYCFDADDTSGSPSILLIHSFTKPGWEYRGEWDDFDSWYRQAKRAHELWSEDPDEF